MEFKVYLSRSEMPEEIARQTDEILVEAFPEEERRELEEVHSLLGSSELELLVPVENGEALGMLMVWNLPNRVFLENFAVRKDRRSCGLGSKMLSFVRQYWQKSVILEVEPPAGETEQKRIAFYQRNGFHLSYFPYLMPNLRGAGEPLPLLLMSCPEKMEDKEARKAAEELYKTAYRNKVRPQI